MIRNGGRYFLVAMALIALVYLVELTDPLELRDSRLLEGNHVEGTRTDLGSENLVFQIERTLEEIDQAKSGLKELAVVRLEPVVEPAEREIRDISDLPMDSLDEALQASIQCVIDVEQRKRDQVRETLIALKEDQFAIVEGNQERVERC